MFADQLNNVYTAAQKGLAKRVCLDFVTPVNLKTVLNEIFENLRDYHILHTTDAGICTKGNQSITL